MDLLEGTESPALELVEQLYAKSSHCTPLFVCCPDTTDEYCEAVHHVAGAKRAEVTEYDMSTKPSGVNGALEKEIVNGGWMVLNNTHQASRMVLRTLGLTLFNKGAHEIAPSFRLFLLHVGDIDINNPEPYCSQIMVPAIFATLSQEIHTQSTLTAYQILAATGGTTTATDVIQLEESIYANEDCVQKLTITGELLPHILELMEALKHNRSVKTVTFEDCTLTAVEVAYITTMLRSNTRLQRLELVQCALTDDCIQELCEGLVANSTLQNLDLSRNPSITDAGIRTIIATLDPAQGGSHLKGLDFQFNNSLRHHRCDKGFHFSSIREFARMLQTNTHLTHLDMSKTKLTSKSVQRIARSLFYNNTIKSLNLGGNRSGDEAGVAIAEAICTHNNTLTDIDIADSGFSVITLLAFAQSLKYNRSLKSLRLDGNTIAQLPEPQHLSNTVYDDQDDNDGDPHADGQDDDSDLEIPQEQVDPVYGPEDEEEEYVPLRKGEEDEMMVQPLAERAIEIISQRYHRLEGINALSEVLRENDVLECLSLAGCGMDDSAVKALVEALLGSDNENLRRVSLRNNYNLDQDGSMAIKNLITYTKTITDLDLGGIGQQVGERAILGLEYTKMLQRLDVSGCELGDETVADLMQSILRNKELKLTHLGFAGNSLTKAGFKDFKEILAHPDSCLEMLDLGGCANFKEWPDKGVACITDFASIFAKKNTRLRELRLQSMGMTDIVAKHLAKGIKFSKGLQEVDVRNNHLAVGMCFKGIGPHINIQERPQHKAKAVYSA